MSKGQASFAFAGLLFGFLVGFVVAHGIYSGQGGTQFTHPPIPPGMTRAGAPPANGTAQPPAASSASAPSVPPNASAGDMATMQNVQRQLAALKEELEKNPRDAEALARMGDFYFDAGMYDKSADYYRKALDVSPGNVNVETDLGTSLRNLGKPQEAMQLFESAVKAEPTHWKGWFNIGIVALYDLHDFARARKAFERVVQIKPGAVDMSKLEEEIERVRSGQAGGGGSS